MKDYYLKLKNRKLTKDQQDIENQIICYIENKYSVKVHACLFNFQDDNESVLRNVRILFETELEKQQVIKMLKEKNGDFLKLSEEGEFISSLFRYYKIEVSKNIEDGHCIFLYDSFEECALENCYAESFQEFKKFREKHFNPETMEKFNPSALFVTYKSKELMEEAERNGEQQKLIDEYYKFIKKYDEHNFITKQKGLLFYFDYPEIALHSRSYSDLYWQRMTRSINDCAVLKEYNLTINSQIYNQKIEEK